MLKNQKTSLFSNNNALLIGYYPHNAIPVFNRIKLASPKKQYVELELFKQQIRNEGGLLPHYTYANSQVKVRWYRTIFFFIGMLFLVLSIFAFRQNIQLLTLFFGNVALLAKGFLGSVCLLLGISATALGYSLCVAKEASQHLVSKAKHKLIRLYARKRLEMGLQGLLFLGKKYTTLKHEYQETLDLIEEQKEKTTHILQEIQMYTTVEASYRELLFNQALAELEDQLQVYLKNFRFVKIPH